MVEQKVKKITDYNIVLLTIDGSAPHPTCQSLILCIVGQYHQYSLNAIIPSAFASVFNITTMHSSFWWSSEKSFKKSVKLFKSCSISRPVEKWRVFDEEKKMDNASLSPKQIPNIENRREWVEKECNLTHVLLSIHLTINWIHYCNEN